MPERNKIYFISDAHLGLFPEAGSAERELILVRWLDSIKDDAAELYLLGDMFDFWYEYRYVVPKGHTRFLGKIAELSDSGVKIHFFTGNHDIWTYDYLSRETGATIYRHHVQREMNGRHFFIGHGDGIGSGDMGYKLLKGIFTCRFLQWMFSLLHPDLALRFGKWWSKNSRYAKGIIAEPYKGENAELQVVFATETLKKQNYDYFIFGHRHIAYEISLGKSKVVNLGDWISHFTYAVWDGKDLELHSADPSKEKLILRK